MANEITLNPYEQVEGEFSAEEDEETDEKLRKAEAEAS
jgi:predicted deacetylase